MSSGSRKKWQVARRRSSRAWVAVPLVSAVLIGALLAVIQYPQLLHPDWKSGNAGRSSQVPGTSRHTAGEPGPWTQGIPVGQQEGVETIRRLLAEARTHRAAGRLTSPPGGNAHLSYRTVLTMDPANTEALQGLKELSDEYAELASAAVHRGRPDVASDYVERGLMLQPNHPQLLVIRHGLERAPEDG